MLFASCIFGSRSFLSFVFASYPLNALLCHMHTNFSPRRIVMMLLIWCSSLPNAVPDIDSVSADPKNVRYLVRHEARCSAFVQRVLLLANPAAPCALPSSRLARLGPYTATTTMHAAASFGLHVRLSFANSIWALANPVFLPCSQCSFHGPHSTRVPSLSSRI